MNKEIQQKGVAIDLRELYRVRMAVMLETGPQTNKYRRIMFTKEQVKAINEVLLKVVPTSAKGLHYTIDQNFEVPMPDFKD